MCVNKSPNIFLICTKQVDYNTKSWDDETTAIKEETIWTDTPSVKQETDDAWTGLDTFDITTKSEVFKINTCGIQQNTGPMHGESLWIKQETSKEQSKVPLSIKQNWGCGQQEICRSPFISHSNNMAADDRTQDVMDNNENLLTNGTSGIVQGNKENGQKCNDGNDTVIINKDTDPGLETTNAMLYACGICGVEFATAESLKVHDAMELHKATNSYKCNGCGKLFSHLRSLIQHVQIHIVKKQHAHGPDSPQFARNNTKTNQYKCYICGKTCTAISELQQHMQAHGPDRNKCEACGKEFTTCKGLKTHARIHRGEKPYTCDTCGHSFRRSGHLKVHVLAHTGEKPHKCYVCV